PPGDGGAVPGLPPAPAGTARAVAGGGAAHSPGARHTGPRRPGRPGPVRRPRRGAGRPRPGARSGAGPPGPRDALSHRRTGRPALGGRDLARRATVGSTTTRPEDRMLLRKIARPLLASAFIARGVDALQHPGPRIPAAQKFS